MSVRRHASTGFKVRTLKQRDNDKKKAKAKDEDTHRVREETKDGRKASKLVL